MFLKNQLTEANIEAVRDSDYFDVLDPAIAPDKPFKPNRLMITFAGLMIGFVFGAMFIYITAINAMRNKEGNNA